MNQKVIPASLWAYSGQDRVGTLYPTNPLSFEYAAEWIAGAARKPLHPRIAVAPGRLTMPEVHAFFENLLPEGDQRKHLGVRHQATSVFGLLAMVGGDTAGALVLLPEGEQPGDPVYQDLNWEQVKALLNADATSIRKRKAIEAAAFGLPEPRISVSGAQFKLLLVVSPEGMPKRPMGSSPSTHILKPDMVRHDIPVFVTAVNETMVMRAAKICGLPTANAFYQPVTKACLVERYDRVVRADGGLDRLWQADFCQLLGKPSDTKYEHDGGPSFKDCYDLLGDSVQPAADRRHLLRWLFFNLYVGNHDSHANNLAMLAAGDGLRLAPFYDLMSTRVYSGLGPRFAFSLGGESEPGKMSADHVLELARSLGVAPRYLTKIAGEMADQVDPAITMSANEIDPFLDPNQQVLSERLVRLIRKNVRQMRKRLLDHD
ncbi:MAG: type toxin-antitoxin system HipA family toxin [Herminiimonas sp.]|nr:type toxin-antitoxin system HipA family toxin [Herminiimonas sp.]